MAQDGEAAKDKDAPGGEGAGAPGSLRGATAPPREKPMIEGKVLRAENQAPERAGEAPRRADEGQRLLGAAAAPVASDASPEARAEQAEARPEPKRTGEAKASAKPADAEKPDEREAREAGAPAPVRSRRASLWPVAIALVLGAVIAVAGAFGLHRLDKTPEKLAALQRRVAGIEHGPTALKALHAGQEGLKRRIDSLAARARKTNAALATLQERVQTLEIAQRQIAKSGKPQKPGPLRPAPTRPAPTRPAPSIAPAALASLAARVGSLEAKLAQLDQRLTGVGARVDRALREARATQDRSLKAASARAKANAVAIIAARLRRDVEAGVAFADDLSALAAQGFDKAKLAALRPVAASGVATPAALAKQFAGLVPQILATQPGPQAKGFFGRLAQGAAHLVHVQKIGAAHGNDLAARVARLTAALKAGAVAEALRQWKALPAAAKSKSQAFGLAAQQRVAALSAAKAIEAEAFAALGKVKS